MNKSNIKSKHSKEQAKTERLILESMDNPFVVKLHYAFQTSSRLFLIVDLLQGVTVLLFRENFSIYSENVGGLLNQLPAFMQLKYFSVYNIFTQRISSTEILNLKIFCLIPKVISNLLTLDCPKFYLIIKLKLSVFVGLLSI